MFKMIGWMIKVSLFAGFVLVLGHLIHWNGRTISDQVRTGLSKAERSEPARIVRRTTQSLIQDAKKAGSQSNLPSRLEDKIPEEARKELSALLD